MTAVVPTGEDRDDEETQLGLIDRVRSLRAAGRFEPAAALLNRVVEGRAGRARVIRALLIMLAGCHDPKPFCAVLIREYATLEPDIARYDFELLEAIANLAMLLGLLELAIVVQRQLLTREPPFVVVARYRLATMLYLTGRRQEAGRLIQEARVLAARRLAEARRKAEGAPVSVLFGDIYAGSRAIGEMCLQFDSFLKARTLGWLDGSGAVFLVDPALVCNPAVLDYWRELVAVQEAPAPPALGLVAACSDNLHCLLVPGQGGVTREVAYARLLEAWHARGLPPTLTLKDAHRTRGRAALAALGLGEGDWFIGLHVREYGWLGDSEESHNATRSADIASYLPMIAAITALGGWVIRLGDNSMTPLPAMPRVFDYANSSLKSDWMDLYLCAAARFVVGTQSGLHLLAVAFGTPVVMTNALPCEAFSLDANGVVIHQKIYSEQRGRLLTVRECFGPEVIPNRGLRHFFDAAHLQPVPNSPEEITDAAGLMLERLQGDDGYNENQRALWQRWREHSNFSGHLFPYRAGRIFLENLADLMPLSP